MVTVCWAIIGPVSIPSSTKWTVTPVDLHAFASNACPIASFPGKEEEEMDEY